ncbi:hypothetical protein C8R45DRAFT_945247 [Mycena sanguinolenta]|nr:hypothetical protein C8R45DRAFT_945247 [Mycena sanguinolenta]
MRADIFEYGEAIHRCAPLVGSQPEVEGLTSHVPVSTQEHHNVKIFPLIHVGVVFREASSPRGRSTFDPVVVRVDDVEECVYDARMHVARRTVNQHPQRFARLDRELDTVVMGLSGKREMDTKGILSVHWGKAQVGHGWQEQAPESLARARRIAEWHGEIAQALELGHSTQGKNHGNTSRVVINPERYESAARLKDRRQRVGGAKVEPMDVEMLDSRNGVVLFPQELEESTIAEEGDVESVMVPGKAINQLLLLNRKLYTHMLRIAWLTSVSATTARGCTAQSNATTSRRISSGRSGKVVEGEGAIIVVYLKLFPLFGGGRIREVFLCRSADLSSNPSTVKYSAYLVLFTGIETECNARREENKAEQTLIVVEMEDNCNDLSWITEGFREFYNRVDTTVEATINSSSQNALN